MENAIKCKTSWNKWATPFLVLGQDQCIDFLDWTSVVPKWKQNFEAASDPDWCNFGSDRIFKTQIGSYRKISNITTFVILSFQVPFIKVKSHFLFRYNSTVNCGCFWFWLWIGLCFLGLTHIEPTSKVIPSNTEPNYDPFGPIPIFKQEVKEKKRCRSTKNQIKRFLSL